LKASPRTRQDIAEQPISSLETISSEDIGVPMRAVLDVVNLVLNLYVYVIIFSAVLSWLVAFNVVNMYSDVVRSIWNVLTALTEPVLRPIREVVPSFGGLDISPVILILLIVLIQRIIDMYVYPNVF
jgi:YggT family protein